MKTTTIALLALALSCTACVNSSAPKPGEEAVNSDAEKEFSSQLSLIESAFQKGDSKSMRSSGKALTKTRFS